MANMQATEVRETTHAAVEGLLNVFSGLGNLTCQGRSDRLKERKRVSRLTAIKQLVHKTNRFSKTTDNCPTIQL